MGHMESVFALLRVKQVGLLRCMPPLSYCTQRCMPLLPSAATASVASKYTHPVTTDQFPSSNFRTETLRIFSVISAGEEVVTGKKKNHQEPHTEKKLGATLVTLSTVSTGVVVVAVLRASSFNFKLQCHGTSMNAISVT